MKRNILIYDRVPGEHVSRWMSGLIFYLTQKDYKIYYASGQYVDFTIKYEYMFIWNGSLPSHKPIIKKAKELHTKVIFVECGFFPQTQYYILDSCGINGDSSLINDDLSWVTQNISNNLSVFAKKYFNNKKWKSPGKYILCPLQLEGDTNIKEHSPFKKMQSFIDHVENKFDNHQILFKTHPVLPYINYRIDSRNNIMRTGDFNEAACNATMVYGINSTCLLQSEMMGVPTTAIGKGFLNAKNKNRQKMLAALVNRQIPIHEIELDYWVLPFLE